ncbi:MAG: hypothetical protein FWH22_11785 [Fibromonadales bacterium]|nr:hypothetical protein [Fibromonadales bacterium]
MVTQENVYSIIAMLTPGILQRLMDERNINEKEASNLLYYSELYKKLEIEETKLWHLSSFALYSLLEEELETGKITWPEEQ